LTHLLNDEDGPWDASVRLRQWASDTFWADLLDCFYCLSLWVAVPFAALLGEELLEKFLLWLAFSAGAILLERTTGRGEEAPPAPYDEENEDEHVMLR
jgi:hypothetical protein